MVKFCAHILINPATYHRMADGLYLKIDKGAISSAALPGAFATVSPNSRIKTPMGRVAGEKNLFFPGSHGFQKNSCEL